ncbi:MAG: DUF302 domain-containing protein [Candidatus Acidiferrales bacterium]
MERLPIHYAGLFVLAILVLAAIPAAGTDHAELKPVVTSTIVTHVNFKSSKPFADVTAALEKQLGHFDPEIGKSFSSGSNPAEIEAKIHAMEGSSGLMVFAVRDHGQLLSLKGKKELGRQYEVGNPLVALEMTQHNLVAGEYAPLRMYVYVGEDKLTHVDYDLPSSVFARFKSKQIDEVARGLDQKLEKLVTTALNCVGAESCR